MNKKFLSVIALTMILAGCTAYAPSDEAIGTLDVSGCTVLPEVDCGDAEGDYKVELDLDEWTLTPECITAKKDKVVSIRIKSSKPIEEATVWVFPKNLENIFWLVKSNSPSKNKIDVTVKGKAPKNKDAPKAIYNYGIWSKGKCIDPRVRVIN